MEIIKSTEKDNSSHAKGRREYHRCTESRERHQECELSFESGSREIDERGEEELSREETEKLRAHLVKKRSTFLNPLHEPGEPGLRNGRHHRVYSGLG
jgi:hypothetical protein